MVSSRTFSKSNTPGEYAPWMVTTITSGEQGSQEKLLRLIEAPSLNTGAFWTTANVPANPTTPSQFIVLQGSINVAEDTSGLGVSFDIHTKNTLFALLWRILVYPDVQPLRKLIGTPTLIIWPPLVERTSIISSKTATADIPVILPDEELSPEDREARKKGLQLVARFEHLAETDEGFRRWLQVGLDQAEAGQVFAFDDGSWEEE